MEHLGSEVSAKIRAAIKAKLIELSAYVDDELPDYIMVMVANRKSPEAMADDLGLFLSHNTKTFVDWLAHVLEKLKRVTLGEGKTKKKSPKKKKKKGKTATGDDGVKKKKKSSPTKKKLKEVKAGGRHKDDIEDKRRSKNVGEHPRAKTFSRSRSPAHKGEHDRSRQGQKPASFRKHEGIHDQSASGRFSGSRSRSPHFHSSERPRRSRSREGHGRDPRDRREMFSGGGDRGRDRYRDRWPEDDAWGSRGRTEEHPRSSRMERQHSNSSPSKGAYGKPQMSDAYDPEQMLKMSLANKDKVRPPRPVEGNRNLDIKAAGDRNKSYRSGDRERQRQDVDELEAVHKKRQQLSRALKEGKLNEEKIEEINRTVGNKQKTTSDRRREPPEKYVEKSENVVKRQREKVEQKKEPRIHQTTKNVTVTAASQPEEFDSSDLRHMLGKGRKSGDIHGSHAHWPSLTVQISNNVASRKAVAVESEDKMLEKMRRRALESMLKRRNSKETKTEIVPTKRGRAEGDDDTDTERKAGGVETPDQSDDSTSGSSESSSSGSSSEISLSDEEEYTRDDPTFIVTLNGVKQRSSQEETSKQNTAGSKSLTKVSVVERGKVKSEIVSSNVLNKQAKPTAPVMGQTRQLDEAPPVTKDATKHSLPVKKPEAKVAPLRPLVAKSNETPTKTVVTQENKSEETKPKRARITAPSPDKPKAPVVKLVPSIISPQHLPTRSRHELVSSPSTATSKEICRFYPNCTRGNRCFFFHPKPRSPAVPPRETDKAKFRWTSASAFP